MVLSFPSHRGVAGDLHRCAPCKGGARYGGKQDGRERRRWSGAARGSRVLSRGSREGFRQHVDPHVCSSAHTVGRNHHRAFQPDLIRGVMKTFGLVVPAGKGSTFEKNARSLLVDQDGLASVVLPMLEAWRGIRMIVTFSPSM